MQELKVRSLLPVRLDKYLMQQFPVLGPGRLNKALRENKIKLNGKKQPLSTRVQNGDVIRIYLLDEQLGLAAQDGPWFMACRAPAELVYENDDLIVALKPAGIPVDGDDADTLRARVLRRLYEEKRLYRESDIRLCHRLDTGTSGLILLAKNPETEEFLIDAIREHRIRKTYLCVTFGRPVPPAATLKGFLFKDAEKGLVRVLDTPRPGTKEIITSYDTIAVSGRLALLRVGLVTGRTHQIRAHFASIGHPLAGDGKYGKNAVNKKSGFPYQALYSYKLRFDFQTDGGLLQYLDGREFTAGDVWFLPEFAAMPGQ